MSTIVEKLSSNKALTNYILYCVSFATYGLSMTCLGPIIPYFSAITGLPQTEYSFLFLTRSLGFVFGALLVRILTKYMTYHAILMWMSIMLAVFLVPFSFVFSLGFQAIGIFGMAAAASVLQIIINLCILDIQKDAHVDFWMLICHGTFGIGGLISPILVYFFGTNVFVIIACIFGLGAPAYYFLKSPEKQHNEELKSQLLDEIAVADQVNPQERANHHLEPLKPTISFKAQCMVCFLFFLYIGMELGFGNWIPSYVVMAEIAPKEEAINFSSSFWLAMTVFRFAASCLPMNAVKKMLFLEFTLIGCMLASIWMVWSGQVMLGCYFGSLMFGMCFSPMFPLLLTLQTDYKLEMTPKQSANCMLACSFGEGIVVMGIGYLMSWLSNDMLFYSLLVCAVVFLLGTKELLRDFQKTATQNRSLCSKQIEMKTVGQNDLQNY